MKYKNILWIDDFDTQDSGDYEDPLQEKKKEDDETIPGNKEVIKDYFGEYAEDVKLKKDFLKALGELKENCVQYDLIIFDIDMNKGIDWVMELKEIKSALEKKRVLVSDKVKQSDFETTAGVYLYLYLLNCGYPNDRMLILTGNGVSEEDKIENKKNNEGNNEENVVDILEKAHILVGKLNKDLIYEKNADVVKKQIWLETYYSGENEYYKVRRLVFKACEYWQEKLREGKEIIIFNSVYYNDEKRITEENFIDMLERIKLLFPNAKPKNPSVIYYQALQVVTMYHEESANINKLKNPSSSLFTLYPYHQAVRNFRNWSAHNKLKKNSIDEDKLAILFCCALRSYFKDDSNEENLFTQRIEYENQFFKDYEEMDEKKLEYKCFYKKYLSVWKRLFEKLPENAKKQKNSASPGYLCEDISEVLYNCGWCDYSNEEEKLTTSDVILGMLGNWILREGSMPDLIWYNDENTEHILKAKSVCECTYKWGEELGSQSYEDYIKEIKESEPLKYYAHILFMKEKSLSELSVEEG